MHAGDYFDREAYTAAWGGLKPMIVGGVNDEFKLPLLPPWWDWLLTRELTGDPERGYHPTYRLLLVYIHPDGPGSGTKARGKIDKKMYGETGVYQLALSMREKHCPQKLEMGSGSVGRVRRALSDASRRAGGQGSDQGARGGDHSSESAGSPLAGAAVEPEGAEDDRGRVAD